MFDFTCPRCDKTLSSKQNLHRHLERKIKCIPVSKESDINTTDLIQELQEDLNKTFKCEHCSKGFSSIYNLRRHQKDNCKIQEMIQDKNVLINDYTIRIQFLQKQLHNIKNGIVINNSKNVKFNHDVIINNFGDENITYLTQEVLSDFLTTYESGVVNLIKYIHFNPDFPENRNVKQSNTFENFYVTFNNKHWSICSKDDIIDTLIKKAHKILLNHFVNYHMKSDTKLDEEDTLFLNEFLFKIRDDIRGCIDIRKCIDILITHGYVEV